MEVQTVGGRLDGKVAVVTGGAGTANGIGRVTAEVLAADGCAVVVGDIDAGSARGVAEAIRAAGGRAIGCELDVFEEDSIAAAMDLAVAEFGGLHVLHNHAMGRRSTGTDGAVTEMTVEYWDDAMAGALRAPMLGCKHAIPRMLASGGGSIVNTSSTAAFLGHDTRTAYGVAKAGINALTLYVATSFGKAGIRCNAVAPGPTGEALRETLSPAYLGVLLDNTLSNRLGRPVDVANCVAFLASDEAAHINGMVIRVDGGLMAHQPTYGQMHAMGAPEA